MSSSRGKNFRRRSEISDANPDDKPTPISSTKTAQTLIRPKNPKPAEAPKRLSFADDEDEDESGSGVVVPRVSAARVRAPAPSTASGHKLNPSKNRSSAPIPSNVQPQSGEYTRERLLELQKNARRLGSIGGTQKPQKPEPVIVVKGLMKPSSPPPGPDPINKEEGESEEVDADMKKKDLFPDQETINAIRAKRERLRQSRAPAPDYISLDGGGVLATRAGGESSDEEDHDFRGRIALFGDKEDDGKVKKGIFEGFEERVVVGKGFVEVIADDDEDDDDDEDKKWEEAQVRKGLGKRIEVIEEGVPVCSAQPLPPVYSSTPQLNVGLGSLSLGGSMLIVQNAANASRALKENITRLKESHNRTMSSLVRTDENLSDALSDITTLEKSLEAAGKKYVFMQQLRDFISIMCDFLKDKALLIEELEEEMQKLHEQRATAVEERRVADAADESREVESAVSAAMSILGKGSSAAYISAATNAAMAALAAARESSNLPVKVDEFGRDVNLQKRMDFTRRAEGRKRRRARTESKVMASHGMDSCCDQIEGEVTTDESDGESTAYESTRNELLQTAEQIFSDAAEEYSNLSIVKEKFENWKKEHLSSYRDAYMSLSAPAVFSPYVRLELLKWDPLYNMADFNNMEWHSLLYGYGLSDDNQEIDPKDADGNLVPVLVEKVALPILHHEVAHCWDIFSTRRTENAVFAATLIISYVEPLNKALQELLAVVCDRLTQAIAGASVPVWHPEVTRIVPGAARFAAYRFGTSVRLLRNVCLWKDVLSLAVLEKLALEELLKGKLLPHIRSIMSNIHDAITRTERIVASLSGVWYGPEVTVDHSQKLKPLVDCVADLGKRLERRRASGANEEETAGLARRLKAMLVQLNEYDRAREMLKTFKLKEAL